MREMRNDVTRFTCKKSVRFIGFAGRASTGGASPGASLLTATELLTLNHTGNSATSFLVNRRYSR